MSNQDYELIIETWECFRDSLPSNRREDAILKMLKLFEEYGFSIHEAGGEDQYIDDALKLLDDDHSDDSSEEEDY